MVSMILLVYSNVHSCARRLYCWGEWPLSKGRNCWSCGGREHGLWYLENLEEAPGATKTIGISMTSKKSFSTNQYVVLAVLVTVVLTLAVAVPSGYFRVALAALVAGLLIKTLGGFVLACVQKLRTLPQNSMTSELAVATKATRFVGWVLSFGGEAVYCFGCVLALLSGRWYPGISGWALAMVGGFLSVGQAQYYVRMWREARKPKKTPAQESMSRLADSLDEAARAGRNSGGSWIN